MTVIPKGQATIDSGGTNTALGPYRAELISDTGGLTQFGMFIEELPSGSRSSHAHWHATEDEMVLILSGTATLHEDGRQTELHAGDAACWKAGDPVGHCLENRSGAPVRYVVIGTRAPADRVTYPALDRVLTFDRSSGARDYTTGDGTPVDGLD